jgi:hypothetical protein
MKVLAVSRRLCAMIILLLFSLLVYLNFGTGIIYLIQINHQPDATVFQFIILTFKLNMIQAFSRPS